MLRMVLQRSRIGARFGVSRRLASVCAGKAAVIASTLILRTIGRRKAIWDDALICVTSQVGSTVLGVLLVLSLAGCHSPPRGSIWEPRPLGPEPTPTGDALVDRANQKFEERDSAAARELALSTLSSDPQNADAFSILGTANWMDGRIYDSTRAFHQALEHKPLHFAASIGLAKNLRAAGDTGESRRLLEALIADDPTQYVPWIGLLDTVWIEGDFDALREVGKETLAQLYPEAFVFEVAKLLADLGGALAGTGPWCVVSGTSGIVPRLWSNDLPLGVVAAQGDGALIRVSTNWGSMIAGVTTEWLEGRGLPIQGKVRWVDGEPAPVVVIPRIEFGELALERVPAIVLPKDSAWHRHRVDVVLGSHALTAFGSIRMNAPDAQAEFTREPPPTPGTDAIVAPLFFLSGDDRFPALGNTLATVLRLDRDGRDIAVYLGAYPEALVLTHAAGAQGELDTPVYMGGRDLQLGDVTVLESGREEPTIDFVRGLTSLQLQGSFNPSQLEGWVVTYALSSRELILEPPS